LALPPLHIRGVRVALFLVCLADRTNPELLVFGYLAQCRCDPTNTIEHFTNFFNVVKILQDLGHIPQELQQAVIDERSRFRYTTEDQANALRSLGFGKDGHLGVDFEPDVPEEFVIGAWRDCVRRAWRDTENGVALQREANDAFRIAAESRGSDRLWALWEAGKGKSMTPDRAYETLEVPKEVDDAMLITVYVMRVRYFLVVPCSVLISGTALSCPGQVEEQPSQTEKMKEALSIIAEIRDSVRLRQFIETGQDRQSYRVLITSQTNQKKSAGEAIVPTRADLPRGLNQLGNTCYLNSLLQVRVKICPSHLFLKIGSVLLHNQGIASSCGTHDICRSEVTR
jgi:ubiquitin carboxyl-terminal hydrolase 25/28